MCRQGIIENLAFCKTSNSREYELKSSSNFGLGNDSLVYPRFRESLKISEFPKKLKLDNMNLKSHPNFDLALIL